MSTAMEPAMLRVELAGRVASSIPDRWKRAARGTRLASFLRRIINATFPEYAQTTITGGPIKGRVLLVSIRSEKFYWLGTHEPEVGQLLAHTICPGWTCYDVGAHIGYTSLQLGQLTGPSGKVYAFEPEAANRERLTKNVEANGMGGLIQVVPYAASSTSGTSFFAPAKHSTSGKLVATAEEGMRTVDTVTLDGFANSEGHAAPDFLKIDVEGGEAEVLVGASGLLRHTRPVILCEVHSPKAAEATLAILQGAGYTVRDADHLPQLVTSVPQQRSHWLAHPEQMP